MLPKLWEPAPTSGLVLVGPAGDGGYVVSEDAARDATLLISMGLNDDWRFEERFRTITGARVLCFDGTVGRGFWLRRTFRDLRELKPFRSNNYWNYRKFFRGGDVQHRRIMIGRDAPFSCSLTTILADVDDKTIFLKIDIEGAEYRILDQIAANRHRVSGMAIEFHDVDFHRERIHAWLEAMSEHAVIALHPNNYGGVDPTGVPEVIELSLAHRRYLTPGTNHSAALRVPNLPGAPDIDVSFA